MKTSLRPAEPRDLADIERIIEAAYTPYIARIGRKPGPMLDDYAEKITRGFAHVADRDGAVKGVLILIPIEGAMLLDNIAVAPEAQGLGLGRLMMEFAERAALAAHCDAIRLYTNVAMTENISLYQRLGYVETHRGEEKDLHRVYMRKRLGGET